MAAMGRFTARLIRVEEGTEWPQAELDKLIGQTCRFTMLGRPMGEVRVTKAWVADGFVNATFEPVTKGAT